MSSYLALLRVPGVARIIAAQLTARLPSGMLSLAFLLHVEQVHDSYGAAGIVLAAFSIGQAISGPLTSRWMGAWGMRPVIALTLVVNALAISVMTLELSVPLFMVGAVVVGLSTPPIQPAVRTVYPKMVTSQQLTPLFSLDASAQEIIWVSGPVITTFVATQVGTPWGIALPAVITILGGIWFLSSKELGTVRIPRSRRAFGRVLARPTVLVATIAGFLLIGTAASAEAGVVAVFGHDGLEAGVVLAIFAVGSLVGGLALGHRPISPWSLATRFVIVLVGVGAAGFILEAWWLAIALLIAGAGIAPVLTVIFSSVSSSLRFSETAEAYGWSGTGQLIGSAAGSALAGTMIDAHGAIGAFAVAAVFAVVGVVAAIVARRWMPDLRGRDASPRPDTEPVPLIT